LSNSNAQIAERQLSYVATVARRPAASTHAKNAILLVRDTMADVIVTFKIMPKDAETDMDKIEEQIKSIVNPERIQREPIAFGLVAIKVTKLIPDAGGELENVENKIKSIKNIGQVEVTEVTRSL